MNAEIVWHNSWEKYKREQRNDHFHVSQEKFWTACEDEILNSIALIYCSLKIKAKCVRNIE